MIHNACIHTYIHTYIHPCMHTYIHTHIHASMHAYIHTSMHPCIHAYMHTYTHTYIHACMHACIHPCIHASMHPCMHTYIHPCIHPYVHTYIHRYIRTYVRTYMHTCIHAYMHAFINTYVRRYVHTYIHACMHACIHACIHTYIHTYVRTYVHTCIHAYMRACIHTSVRTYIHAYICVYFPVQISRVLIGRLERWNVLTFVFLPLWVHVSLVCLQILVWHTWEICCCQLCARHPWLSFPHSPSKFCQALRLAFHAPLISIGLSRISGTFLSQENLYLTIQAAKGLSALFLSRCRMSHCSASEGSSRLSFGRWQRYCILARRSLAAFNSSSRYLYGHLQWILHGDWILWAWLISEPGVLVRDFLSFSVVLAVRPCNVFRWPDVSWNYGDSTRDDKGRVQRCVCFPYYAGQVCQLGHISASCRKTDANPAFVPVCHFTLCSLVAARWEAGVIPLFCLMYCCFPDWNPNLKFAACKTEGFAKSLKLCTTQRSGFWIDRTFRSCVRLMRSSTQLGSQRYHYIPLHYSYSALHYIATLYNTIQYKTKQYNTLRYITCHTYIVKYMHIYIYV